MFCEVIMKDILAGLAKDHPDYSQIEKLAAMDFRLDSRDGTGWTCSFVNGGVPHVVMGSSPNDAILRALTRLALTVGTDEAPAETGPT